MARKHRINYTETDKALMWERWQQGESLEKIAQLFDRSHGSVAAILRRTGGIRPPRGRDPGACCRQFNFPHWVSGVLRSS